MNIGGLATRAALLREQLKKSPCKRCGLHYDHKKYQACPHCSNLSEVQLREYFEKREQEYQGNRQLGFWFFIFAAIIGFMMVIYTVR